MAALTVEEALRLALDCFQRGQFAETESLCRKVLAAEARHPDAWHLLGVVAGQTGRWQAAVEATHTAIAAAPNIAHYHANLAIWLAALGRHAEAAAACEQAIQLQPDYAEAHYNLGNIRLEERRYDEAAAAFREALRLAPQHVNALANLASVLQDCGQIDEAVEHYRSSLAFDPDHATNHSSLLFAANYHPGFDAAAIAAEHRLWCERHAAPGRAEILPHSNDRSPDRKLRIGFVSADLREHPVGFHLLVWFREHDRRLFETVAYSGVKVGDAVTAKMQSLAASWCDASALDDRHLAQRIRADGIDLLVDCSLHSAGHRLLTFARKPAPVQVTFAGYPGTTGLPAIDYRLTDRWLDPETAPSPFIETPWRLPDSFWCFDPFDDAPGVQPPPCIATGHVTFGSLCNFAKVNDAVLALWSRVLAALPQTKMRVLAPEGSARERVRTGFAKNGIDLARLDFIPWQPRRDYLREYQQVDVVLDPFPYTGHTTTLDALWMGVPTVTLAGATPVARGGLSILTTAGLPELVARTEDEYVRIARELATNPARLAALRASLREQVRASPLMDAPRFARNLEIAFRALWKDWCQRA